MCTFLTCGNLVSLIYLKYIVTYSPWLETKYNVSQYTIANVLCKIAAIAPSILELNGLLSCALYGSATSELYSHFICEVNGDFSVSFRITITYEILMLSWFVSISAAAVGFTELITLGYFGELDIIFCYLCDLCNSTLVFIYVYIHDASVNLNRVTSQKVCSGLCPLTPPVVDM